MVLFGSESEIDVFESVDRKRREDEMVGSAIRIEYVCCSFMCLSGMPCYIINLA